MKPELSTTELQSRIAVLEEALREYTKPENWRHYRRFDPNSPFFDGVTFATEALGK